MSRSQRIAAFEAWLRAHGTAAEIATFKRSVVDGLVVLAGTGALTAEHVARAVALARDSGMTDTSAVEVLGALYLKFEASGGQTDLAVAIEASIVSAPETPDLSPLPAAAFPPPPEIVPPSAPPPPAPIAVKLRAATAPPVAVAADASAPDKPERGARARFGYALAAVLLAALVVVGLRLRSHQDDAVVRQAPPRTRLHRVPLSATLPAGWREATDAELAGSGSAAPPSSLVFRGASAADPERGMFVAVLPPPIELAGTPADAALIAAASTAERALGGQFGGGAGAYESHGCAVVTLGGVRTGACLGTAQHGGERAAFATYVRVVAAKEIVAVLVARPPIASARAEDEAVVASLAP